MQRLVSLLVLVFIVSQAFSQVRPAGRRDVQRFHQSTTYVVEDRDPFSRFNEHMRKAMERHWTITPFQVITFQEFERMRTDENKSFMIFADIKQQNLEEVYEFINFVMGDRKRDFESMPDLGSVPLAYRDANQENYFYKMGAFVKFMQTYVQEQASTPRIRLTRFFSAKDARLKTMELWLLEEEMAPQINTIEKIKQYYPYPVRFATREEIAEAIAQDREDVAFLHKIGPEDTMTNLEKKCWKFVMWAKDGRVLFATHHDIDRNNPDALLASDLQKMAE
ncbi:MAG: hypothetical protein ACK4VN_01560 [Bacteroidales bacterium]